MRRSITKIRSMLAPVIILALLTALVATDPERKE
jgi:hypothetical protein